MQTKILVLSNSDSEFIQLKAILEQQQSYVILQAPLSAGEYLWMVRHQRAIHFLLIHNPSVINEVQKIIKHFQEKYPVGVCLFINREDIHGKQASGNEPVNSLIIETIEWYRKNEPGINTIISNDLLFQNASSFKAISKMERQIIQHLAMGKQDIEIADQLNLSVRTIETYIRNLLQRLNLRNRPHLIHFAHQYGLLS